MKRLTRKEAYYYGALLYAFLLPFHQKVATLALILWGLLSVISFDRSTIVKNRYLLILPGFYLLYVVGVFTSEIPSYSFLETKLSFLIFPLIFFLHPYVEIQRQNIVKSFVYGVALSGVFCLIYATYQSVGFENETLQFKPNVLAGKGAIESILYGGNYYFGSFLSIFHQTVYAAMYISAALTVLLYRSDWFKRRTAILLGVFFLGLLFLISNKAAILTLGVMLMLRIFTLKQSTTTKLIGVTVIVLGIGIFVWTNPRTHESLQKLANGELVLNKNARYDFTTRLLSWDAASTLIKKNPIVGYGTGDVQTKLNEVYAQKEYVFPLKEEYNAHNLWLQTWLENGVFGLLLLGGLFFVLFKKGLRGANFFGFTITLVAILFVNSLFESMFHRFSGISFFSFIVCYVLTSFKSKELIL